MFIDEFKYKILNNTNISILHLFEAYEFLQKYLSIIIHLLTSIG